MTFREDGLAVLDREGARRGAVQRLPPRARRGGLDRLRPGNLAGADQPLTGAAWRDLPATYVGGSEDRMPGRLH